ncbi:hypothetical protein D623_10006415 [Myotis brandtii]|uniref:Uncharacterized protein n=1 Tax=Myotis brandtii TaxID=109478 RepID=S7MRG8_MYOBR|nr:hypothetical protein D623_10006415 [Myotis brandtii]
MGQERILSGPRQRPAPLLLLRTSPLALNPEDTGEAARGCWLTLTPTALHTPPPHQHLCQVPIREGCRCEPEGDFLPWPVAAAMTGKADSKEMLSPGWRGLVVKCRPINQEVTGSTP